VRDILKTANGVGVLLFLNSQVKNFVQQVVVRIITVKGKNYE
jgi:hypothetical protein